MADTNPRARATSAASLSRPGSRIGSTGSGLASARTPPAGALESGRPRFTTPLNASQRLYPLSTGNIRRPSAEVYGPHPSTPTPSNPATASRPIPKGWAAVAAKSVDALRGSRLTNYSKRTPYKGRGPGAGRTVCIYQTREQYFLVAC